MSKRAVVFAISLIFSVSLFSAPVHAAERKKEPAGAVVAWKGTVLIYREGKKGSVKVRRPEAVYPNDIVTTNLKSRAKILLNDDSVLSLGENASVKVRAFGLKKDLRKALVTLVAGRLRSIVGSVFGGESYFNIETETAIVGVKGTDFYVGSLGKNVEVLSLSGEVTVKGAVGEVVLKPGEGLCVKAGSLGAVAEASQEAIWKIIEDTAIPVTHPLESIERGCAVCHEPVATAMEEKPHRHPVECGKCHSKGFAMETEIRVDSYSTDTIVLLSLNEGVGYTAKIKAMDRAGASDEATVEFTPMQLSEPQAEAAPPVITDLTAGDVRKDVFYSVVIAYSTDEPARGSVEYGYSEKYGSSVKGPDHYATNHRITIDRVDPDSTIYARVAVEDIFGNKSAGTLKFKAKKTGELKSVPPAEGAMKIKGVTVFKVKGKTAIRWKTSAPSSALLSSIEPLTEKAATGDPHYPGLKEGGEIGIYACMECHKGKIHLKTTHPVGVVDWLEAEKPVARTQPTGKVERATPLGRQSEIYCTTCHAPHGSSHGYMLRLGLNVICAECHGVGAAPSVAEPALPPEQLGATGAGETFPAQAPGIICD